MKRLFSLLLLVVMTWQLELAVQVGLSTIRTGKAIRPSPPPTPGPSRTEPCTTGTCAPRQQPR